MTIKQAYELIPGKSYIIYAKSEYRVAGLFCPIGLGATHIEIYDEPPSKHIDRVLISSCEASSRSIKKTSKSDFINKFYKGELPIK